MSLPNGVQIPKSSGQFMKLQDGKNKFRIMSNVIHGWECWKDKKPTRHEGQECKFKPEEADLNQNGRPNINYFWAMGVWNYEEKRIQTLQITQKTIMEPLLNYEQNPEWGDLKGYDIEVLKKKEGDKVSYIVSAIPPKPVAPEIVKAYEEAKVDLSKLFDGKYPMEEKKVEYPQEEGIDVEAIPF